MASWSGSSLRPKLQGSLPAPAHRGTWKGYRRLMELAEQAFAEAEARGVTGKPLLWDLAKQDMREDLTTFLEEDARLRTINGTHGVMPEARFGLGGETPEVADEGTGLSFRGIIDPAGLERRRRLGPGHRLQDRQQLFL